MATAAGGGNVARQQVQERRASSEPPPTKHVVTVSTHPDSNVRPSGNRNPPTAGAARTLPVPGSNRPSNSAAQTNRAGAHGGKPLQARHVPTSMSHPELRSQAAPPAGVAKSQATNSAARTSSVASGSNRPTNRVPQSNRGASGNNVHDSGATPRKHITVVSSHSESNTRPPVNSRRNQSTTTGVSRTLPSNGSSRPANSAAHANQGSGHTSGRPTSNQAAISRGNASGSAQTANKAGSGNARHANNQATSNRDVPGNRQLNVTAVSVNDTADGVAGNNAPANNATTVTNLSVSGNGVPAENAVSVTNVAVSEDSTPADSVVTVTGVGVSGRHVNNATGSNRDNAAGNTRSANDNGAASTLQNEAQIQQPATGVRAERDNARAASATHPRPVSNVSDIMINISDVRQLVDPSRRGQLDALSSQGHENILMRPETLQTLQGMQLAIDGNNEALPDILNSHLLPPYAVRPNQHRSARQGAANARPQPSRPRTRAGRSHRHRQPSPTTHVDDEGKTCCGCFCCLHCITVVTQFRWVLLSLAMLGVICIVTGIILGAIHMSVSTSFLTLSLMFIGLGVMLVVVVGIGWRCTPIGHEPCHLLFNLGEHSLYEYGRRHRNGRRPRDRNQWFGGVLYPEFRYRRPPPSYTASMQDYQHQMMIAQLLDDGRIQLQGDGYALPNSPPPTYRSHASTVRGGMHITFPPTPQGGADHYPSSRPPTYRSNVGTTDDRSRPTIPTIPTHGIDNPVGVGVESTGSASSTMHRAQAVVSYLDDVINAHQGGATSGSEGVGTPSPSSAASGSRDSIAVIDRQCADTAL